MSHPAVPSLNAQIKRFSLTESVYDTLLESILNGSLPPGTVLNTVALAEQLDVSRTPVKEALRLLTHDGLVEQMNNLRARVIAFTRDDIVEIYEVRMQLEATAAERAARKISDEALSQLRAQADTLMQSREEVDWASRVIEYDIRFHDTLAEASGNKRLRNEIARYRLLVRGFCRLTGREPTLLDALKEHIAILEAIQARRPATARKAMITHVESRLAAVLQDVCDDDP